MTAFTIGCVLLVTSIVSLAVYVLSLLRLLAYHHNRGLVRTTTCRVIAAGLYTVISMATIAGHRTSGLITVVTFIAIQLIWQLNTIADVLLAKQANRRSTRGGGDAPIK